MRSLRTQATQGDLALVLLSAALMGIGLVAIASASVEYGDFHFGDPGTTPNATRFTCSLGLRQGVWRTCVQLPRSKKYRPDFCCSRLFF